MKQFLGLAQYYAIYMKNFALVAAPLTAQLKTKTPDHRKIVWTPVLESA